MNRKLLATLLSSILIATTVGTAQAETNSLDLTVKTNIKMVTCTATVQHDGGSNPTISIGNVGVLEILNKSKVKPFTLQFDNCVNSSTVKVQIVPRGAQAHCGNNANPEFANNSWNTGAPLSVGMEIWSTSTPEGSGSTQFSCIAPSSTEQTVNITGSTTQYPMSVRLMKSAGYEDSSVTPGAFLAQTQFNFTYN